MNEARGKYECVFDECDKNELYIFLLSIKTISSNCSNNFRFKIIEVFVINSNNCANTQNNSSNLILT